VTLFPRLGQWFGSWIRWLRSHCVDAAAVILIPGIFRDVLEGPRGWIRKSHKLALLIFLLLFALTLRYIFKREGTFTMPFALVWEAMWSTRISATLFAEGRVYNGFSSWKKAFAYGSSKNATGRFSVKTHIAALKSKSFFSASDNSFFCAGFDTRGKLIRVCVSRACVVGLDCRSRFLASFLAFQTVLWKILHLSKSFLRWVTFADVLFRAMLARVPDLQS
jgi:hypothetical protein